MCERIADAREEASRKKHCSLLDRPVSGCVFRFPSMQSRFAWLRQIWRVGLFEQRRFANVSPANFFLRFSV